MGFIVASAALLAGVSQSGAAIVQVDLYPSDYPAGSDDPAVVVLVDVTSAGCYEIVAELVAPDGTLRENARRLHAMDTGLYTTTHVFDGVSIDDAANWTADARVERSRSMSHGDCPRGMGDMDGMGDMGGMMGSHGRGTSDALIAATGFARDRWAGAGVLFLALLAAVAACAIRA